MPKVLHIGPCETPGGMANVMRILAEHPPEGWRAELLSSHTSGSPFVKWRAYRHARASFSRMLKDSESRPDIVHLHTAADWSWWRKRRFAKMAHHAGVPNVVHIHSGQFDTWLKSSKVNQKRFITSIKKFESNIIVLSQYWKDILEIIIGRVTVINNPVNPNIGYDSSITRDIHHLLLLGRDDPVKGHQFAVELTKELRKTHPQARLTLTGVDQNKYEWVDARGWVSEIEKINLLQKATVLLVPSLFEGQPLAALEALFANCPVIASDTVHSLPSTVLIAKFGNVASWLKVYESLLPMNVAESVQSFAIEHIQSQWQEYYSNILSSNTFVE